MNRACDKPQCSLVLPVSPKRSLETGTEHLLDTVLYFQYLPSMRHQKANQKDIAHGRNPSPARHIHGCSSHSTTSPYLQPNLAFIE
jgi:hypothetical protein